MWLHPVTLTALLCPLLTFLLCSRCDLLDHLTFSMCEAAAFSLSGVVMWLRARYLATLYLNERQNRKTVYLANIRRDVSATSSQADAAQKEGVDQSKHESQAHPHQVQQQRCPRTVARVAPVRPAFMACCFFLLSFYGLMSAVLHVIWFVRSELAEP